jgi:hypothetical protein
MKLSRTVRGAINAQLPSPAVRELASRRTCFLLSFFVQLYSHLCSVHQRPTEREGRLLLSCGPSNAAARS